MIGGNYSSNKTFINLPAHWSLSVRFDVIMLNLKDWNPDADSFHIILGNNFS